MKRARILMVLAAAFPLASVSAVAGQAEQDAVRKHCETELNVPAGVCPCLAGKAASMSEGQQQLLAAMANGDDASAARVRGQLPLQEVMQVGMFYVQQTPACAGG